MFAISRTERVTGRAIILTVSIRTRKGFNAAGAPIGRSAATTELGADSTPEIIRESQRGNPKEKEIAR